MLNPTKKQRSTRTRALTLKSKTDDWIIPRKLWKIIDDEKWNDANKMLDKIKKVWLNDPMVTYVDSFIFASQSLTRALNNEK